MKVPIRLPEEILAHRSLSEIIGDSRTVWSVKPSDNVSTALQLMIDRDIGFVVVHEDDALVGVLSERDCARRVLAAGKPPNSTRISDVMVRDVIGVDQAQTFAECLRLMHEHRVRHLPVLQAGRVIAVVSARDLMGEAVEHYRKVVGELERERMTMLTSTA